MRCCVVECFVCRLCSVVLFGKDFCGDFEDDIVSVLCVDG